jgi:hypothetical protein
VRGTRPPKSAITFLAAPTTDLALLLKKPVLRISAGQHFRAHGGEIRWGGILGEQAGRHFVDALIGALGGKNGGHQQFPRVAMMEGAGGGGVHFVQAAQDFGHALLSAGLRFSGVSRKLW